MEKKVINPWQWQDQFGFAQGISVDNPQRVLMCAGQTSVRGSSAVQSTTCNRQPG